MIKILSQTDQRVGRRRGGGRHVIVGGEDEKKGGGEEEKGGNRESPGGVRIDTWWRWEGRKSQVERSGVLQRRPESLLILVTNM